VGQGFAKPASTQPAKEIVARFKAGATSDRLKGRLGPPTRLHSEAWSLARVLAALATGGTINAVGGSSGNAGIQGSRLLTGAKMSSLRATCTRDAFP